ncbi:hypothetical protein I0C86_40620 [Plantactinospora sp. S1510]|uniref:Uncharacterized protein n=1 Tax=Plantactinospora alkalitolerans TaxID=2789879 RepID=A0ABS0H9N0_9ACTN|nr:hypothetical protein [Plantactinospora alkalitolerans]MBF9135185.1 hypothetical protein [Plantactinospora alkalitolerans]
MKIKLVPTLARFNPDLPRHAWVKKIRHHRNCAWCEIAVRTVPGDWSLAWSWPADPRLTDGVAASDTSLPSCTGPRAGRNRLLRAVRDGSVSPVTVDGRTGFEAAGRPPLDATAAIRRAEHDSLVRLVGEQYPQPELTDLGERWLRLCDEFTGAAKVAAR